ncbi:MAG: endolytic transglycosylase MltG, partial [Clostridia bacterium]|nr:endolytic transglycosylase MltG [Clostridia bacterium]
YIAFVVVVSAGLATVAIRWANDVFALVKDEVVETVSIPENATLSEVSGILKERGIIEYPFVFRLYVSYRHRNDDPPLSFKSGEFELKSTLNYDQITNILKFKTSRQIVKITIPEGLTVNETIDLFLEKGIGTREGFVAAINEYPYEYAFMDRLNAIEFSEGRAYRLEGYLFPDTYEFYTDSGEVAIVDKMLTAFEAHFEKANYDRLEELGMNLDQVITIASMVQMEGRTANDFYSISGVFYNRLHNANYPFLQSDATVQYAIQAHKEDLTAEDLSVASPYNTYVNRGLPPGPIANPGWSAIQAALYPEQNDYYFFIADVDGTTLFARNMNEHQRNAARVTANRAAQKKD